MRPDFTSSNRPALTTVLWGAGAVCADAAATSKENIASLRNNEGPPGGVRRIINAATLPNAGQLSWHPSLWTVTPTPGEDYNHFACCPTPKFCARLNGNQSNPPDTSNSSARCVSMVTGVES